MFQLPQVGLHANRDSLGLRGGVQLPSEEVQAGVTRGKTAGDEAVF